MYVYLNDCGQHKTQLKIPNGMRYKGSAAAETMMPIAASLPGQ